MVSVFRKNDLICCAQYCFNSEGYLHWSTVVYTRLRLPVSSSTYISTSVSPVERSIRSYITAASLPCHIFQGRGCMEKSSAVSSHGFANLVARPIYEVPNSRLLAGAWMRERVRARCSCIQQYPLLLVTSSEGRICTTMRFYRTA